MEAGIRNTVPYIRGALGYKATRNTINSTRKVFVSSHTGDIYLNIILDILTSNLENI
jgi:hypothetical protein